VNLVRGYELRVIGTIESWAIRRFDCVTIERWDF